MCGFVFRLMHAYGMELWIETLSPSSSPKSISRVSVCVCMLFIYLFIYLSILLLWCSGHFLNLHKSASLNSQPNSHMLSLWQHQPSLLLHVLFSSQLLPAFPHLQQSEAQLAVSSSLFILFSSFQSLLLLINFQHGKCETQRVLWSPFTHNDITGKLSSLWLRAHASIHDGICTCCWTLQSCRSVLLSVHLLLILEVDAVALELPVSLPLFRTRCNHTPHFLSPS